MSIKGSLAKGKKRDDTEKSSDDLKLELRLNVKDLEALETAFSFPGDGYDNKLSLTKNQFCEALSLVLNKGSRSEYEELFDQVDIAREGMVDWDKIASHMLLTFYEKDDKVKSNLLPNWKDLRILPGPHKDTILHVVFIRNIGRYLTMSKEGNAGLWGQDLRLQRSVKITTDSCKPRDLWVTDFVALPNVNKVAASFTSKEIAFYDMGAKLELSCQYRLQYLYKTPLCLTYWFNPDNPNEATMAWGDSAGYVNIILWSSAGIALFERPHQASQEKEETTLNVKLSDIEGKGKTEVEKAYQSIRFLRYNAHSDWVRQVRYINNLDCFVSCATTWNDAMCIGWMEKRLLQTTGPIHAPQRNTHFQVHQGINAFDYHPELNLLATAGVAHHICLWNPYVVSKPNGLLRGHMAPVVQVQFNLERNQIISFSKDKVLRIWDVQLQVCIQRLAGVFPKDHEVNTTIFFQEERGRLFLTFNHAVTILEMKPEYKERIITHEKSIAGALLLKDMNQLVTAGQTGVVTFWMLETGQKVKSIHETHVNADLTCIAQDPINNRILTGSTDGTVKIWDSNGHLFHILNCMGGNPAEIGQIVLLKRSIVVVGMSRQIVCFKNSSLKTLNVEPSDWKGGTEHSDDILSATFLPSNTLVTGSYDGEIIVWNTNSEQASRRITSRSGINKSIEQPPHNKRKLSFKSDELEGPTIGPFRTLSASNGQPKARNSGVGESAEIDFSVSRIHILANRVSQAKDSGNLATCGGNGFVRFWNLSTCQLYAEFVAHERVGSIIMSISENEQYLATGDVDGCLKIWEIANYAKIPPSSNDGQHETQPPPILCQWPAHTDMINSILFYERQDRQLIITGSADCAVTMWDVNGHKIGTFGQEGHWKIEALKEMLLSDVIHEEDTNLDGRQNEKEVLDDDDIPSLPRPEITDWSPDPTATEDPSKFRINAWKQTCLGVSYQNLRLQKRERRQPTKMDKLPFLFYEKTGQPPFGPFYSLEVSECNNITELERPDFCDHPEKYFADREDIKASAALKLPTLTEDLKACFDERTLFPKYVLDFDAQMKKIAQQVMDRNDRNDTSAMNMPRSRLGTTTISHNATGPNNSQYNKQKSSKLRPIHK